MVTKLQFSLRFQEAEAFKLKHMTEKQFYDWQTLGGTDDVMRFVNALEKADIVWCAIGGVAVNHWAAEQMVTQDVDFVVAADSIQKAEEALVDAGFKSEKFEWSINFTGNSKISIQLTTEDFYRDFAKRGVAADVHGILLRVAMLEDTLSGKIRAWSDATRRQSKRIKDLADIARLVESHPYLWEQLTDELKPQIERPMESGHPRPQ
jgi:Nucleotidyl transferase AbiEii toxin, Type IV TA system